MTKEIKDETIKAYALKNAIEHEGQAQAGKVIQGLFAEGLKKEQIGDIVVRVGLIVNEVNNLGIALQKLEFEKLKSKVSERETREGLEELPKVGKKGVIMRFAPSASGTLHIGHAVSNVISSLYVKKYGGKFYIRIEDTNPESIDPNAYKQFKEDCDWLFGNVAEYIIQSDRMEVYYKYSKALIKRKSAYVCTCDNQKFKEYIKNQEECPCRNLSVKENLERWEKMMDKNGFKEGEAVLRFKSDMNDKNPAMRDFPLARINIHTHPRQKNKFRVWPLMNLAVTVDDLEYGMTHIIRGKDHRDNAERQKKIYKALGKEKKYPWVFFMGRVKFTDIDLSKRKIKAAIEAGEYEGFDDVRLPTLASLRKRGYKPEAFWKMAEQRGLTEVDKVISQKDFFEVLDKLNK